MNCIPWANYIVSSVKVNARELIKKLAEDFANELDFYDFKK